MLKKESDLEFHVENKGGKIGDLPYSLRKTIYDEFMKIDMNEHEEYLKELQAEGKEGYAAGWKPDIPGLSFLMPPLGGETIVVLMNILVQETGEKKVMTLNFINGEESKLLEKKDMINA